MPCGGIYPIKPGTGFYNAHGNSLDDNCFFCTKAIEKKDLMFCEEWDCFLHRDCVMHFLKTKEGEIVLSHGHEVVLYFEREEENAESNGDS